MITLQDWIALHRHLEPAERRLLLEHFLGMSHAAQITHPERSLTQKESEDLEKALERLEEGEPLPYVLGEQDFFGRTFKVNPSVLIPRNDTECLVEYLIDNLPKKVRVCDLGTGSGCIALTLALERPDLEVFASDISSVALATARANAERLGAEVRFFKGSWLNAYPSDLEFNAVVSNPPYIRPDDPHLKSLTFEPISALSDGNDGLSCYRTIFYEVHERPSLPDMLVFEHGWDQAQQMRALGIQNGFPHSEAFKDYGGNFRFTVFRRC